MGKSPCVYWDCRLEEETNNKTEEVPVRLFLHLRGQQDSSDADGEGDVIVITIRER